MRADEPQEHCVGFFLNSAPPTDDQSGYLSAGNGFLMRQGYQCTLSNTCAKMFEINSETEYWSTAASLLTTDSQGRDLDLGARLPVGGPA